jgi:hypothetical protein
VETPKPAQLPLDRHFAIWMTIFGRIGRRKRAKRFRLIIARRARRECACRISSIRPIAPWQALAAAVGGAVRIRRVRAEAQAYPTIRLRLRHERKAATATATAYVPSDIVDTSKGRVRLAKREALGIAQVHVLVEVCSRVCPRQFGRGSSRTNSRRSSTRA